MHLFCAPSKSIMTVSSKSVRENKKLQLKNILRITD